MPGPEKQAKVSIVFGSQGLNEVRDQIQQLQQMLAGMGGGGAAGGGAGRVAWAPRGGAIAAPPIQAGAGPGSGFGSPMFGMGGGMSGGFGSLFGPNMMGGMGSGLQMMYVTAQTVHIEAKGGVTISGGGSIGTGAPVGGSAVGGGPHGNDPGPPIPAPDMTGGQAVAHTPWQPGYRRGMGQTLWQSAVEKMSPGMQQVAGLGASMAPGLSGIMGYLPGAALVAAGIYGVNVATQSNIVGQQARFGYQEQIAGVGLGVTAGQLPSAGYRSERAMAAYEAQLAPTKSWQQSVGFWQAQDVGATLLNWFGVDAQGPTERQQQNEHEFKMWGDWDQAQANLNSLKARSLGVGASQLSLRIRKVDNVNRVLGSEKALASMNQDPGMLASSTIYGQGAWGADVDAFTNQMQAMGLQKDPSKWPAFFGAENQLALNASPDQVIQWLTGSSVNKGNSAVLQGLVNVGAGGNIAGIQAYSAIGANAMPGSSGILPFLQQQYLTAQQGQVYVLGAQTQAYKATMLEAQGATIGDTAQAMKSQADLLAQAASSATQIYQNAVAQGSASQPVLADLAMKAQAAQTAAAQASKQSSLYVPQQQYAIATSQYAAAQIQVSSQAYSGQPAMTNAGFQAEKEATAARIRGVQAMLANPRLTPSERAEQEAKLVELKEVLKVEIPRQQMQMAYGEATSTVGVKEAGVQKEITQAGLFGSPSDVASARRQELDVIQDQLKVEKDHLAALQQGLGTIQERNEAQSKIKDLETKQISLQEDINRQQAESQANIYGMQAATTGTRAADVTRIMGSAAGFQGNVQSIGQTKQQIQTVDAEISRLTAEARAKGEDPNQNEHIQSKKLEKQQLQSQQLSSETALATYTPPPGLRSAERQNEMYGELTGKTFAGYGNVRAYYENQLALSQTRMEGIQSQFSKAYNATQDPLAREAIKEQMQIQMGQEFSKSTSAQEQLEHGWQERLISNVMGQNGNFNMVAGRFSMQEASTYYGVMNRAFGGTQAQMQYQKGKGSLWMNSYLGAIQHPEGFAATAMNNNISMIEPIPPPDMSQAGGSVGTVTGKIDVNVTVHDSKGNPLGSTQDNVQVIRQALNQASTTYAGNSMSR